MKLGINGLGRIGKLSLWDQVARKYFDEIVVNMGREAGTSLADVAHYVERDSTYGPLHGFLYGHRARRVIEDIDDGKGTLRIDGLPVRVLRESRNPADVSWAAQDVKLVIEATGRFVDPTLPADHPEGALRGHLRAGAERVLLTAPFKIRDKGAPMPEDAVTTVMGVNEGEYDPRRHRLVSNASCTTTCLAHMMKPLIDYYGARRILLASMATVHAVTGSQEVLDRPPKRGARDLRKNRSVFNNIILTSTGAADTLGLVIPEMKEIGFIAESVRIPNTTGSLIILVVNFQEDSEGVPVGREELNAVFKDASEKDPRGYLHYTEEQNVSMDIIGIPRAATIVEGHETHTRTAEISLDLQRVRKRTADFPLGGDAAQVRIAVTQAVIYGWYDNEMGSYVNMLGDRAVSVAEHMS